MVKPPVTLLAALLYASSPSGTAGGALIAELKPATVSAFDQYVKLAEARIDAEVRRPLAFLYLDTLAEARRKSAEAAVRRGEIVIEALKGPAAGERIEIPDGRVHHWLGVGFIPGAGLDEAVKLLQDYDRHAEIYRPAVQKSKTLERDGDRFRVFLRFYQKKMTVAVTVNSEHEAAFFRPAADRVHSRIRSTRIAEVEDAGTAGEREKPVGQDGGYLWRLYTYWRFLERDSGTYIQCESITLTRDIPFGLGWLIGPFVTSIPRESLTFTMERTRQALTGRPGAR